MDDQNADAEYIKRVNDGYLLAKHMPELAAQIKHAVKEKEDGFLAGMEQFSKEQEKNVLLPWMQKDRLSSLDKETDQDIDMDKEE